MADRKFPLDSLGISPNYSDWAITGANCIAYFSSTEDRVQRILSGVPVVAVGYEIQQNKVPLYGLWDIGPRHIASGTRVVSGQLVVAHFYVGMLEEKLRSLTGGAYGSEETLSMDEEKCLKYWNARSWADWMQDPQRTNNFTDTYNVFYRHPSFDISIVYGTGDEVGATLSSGGTGIDLSSIMALSSEWSASSDKGSRDVNPLYRPSEIADKGQRETISGVQLTGKQKSVAADGDIIVESFSFVAIDVINA